MTRAHYDEERELLPHQLELAVPVGDLALIRQSRPIQGAL